MNTFEFGTKAETLKKLKPLVTNAKIPDHLSFSVTDWQSNPEYIISQIQSFFSSDKLVFRSSAIGEDSASESLAGVYESVLNVDKTSESIMQAVESVKNSFLKNNNNPLNQIFVQPHINDVIMSGVMFTRCNNTSAPYFIINYEESSNTESVTSGKSSNLRTFIYFKQSGRLPSSPHLQDLLNLGVELEKITGFDALDVEFAINQEGVHLLQVRPLTTIKKDAKLDENISKTIATVKEFIKSNEKRFPNLHGYKALFGVMPDWNPAEIVGESPKPLALSLYKELITDYIWPLSRKEVGYKDVGYHPGVVSLGGKGYVDVRLSFNTFVPASISETTSEKLVNFYIDKLINNPEMHDKIEFKIALTCYKVGFEKEEAELKQNNFSLLQIKEIKSALLDLTNNIVNEKYTSINYEMGLAQSLNSKRDKIIKSDIPEDVKISQLIHDCKYYGTLPFSKLARFAFVGNIILRSLVENEVITEDEKESFFKSINSIATQFLEKLSKLKKGEISKEQFLDEFGHLRPGTYDLCSGTYRESFSDYFITDSPEHTDHTSTSFEFSYEKKEKISNALKEAGFAFDADTFLSFAKKALVAREDSKFEFTKNLSLILDYCYDYLKKYNFPKEDLTYLEISDVVSFSHKSKSISEIEDLRTKVEKNKELYKVTKSIRLPPIIYMERSAEYFHLFDNKPNFITNRSVSGETIFLDSNSDPNEIKGKIVLITNADPGYDWVFGHNIKGLLTKYGGVASHMSIRCAEFNLPAAIGCGSTIFDYVRNFKKIELNCATQQITGIS
ncbi:MAG: PEP/pyruvate-binding domain-containing protein [archaeon]